MITEAEWNAMSPEQQALAWLAELSGMIQDAVSRWHSSIQPGNRETRVSAGVFNIVVDGRPNT